MNTIITLVSGLPRSGTSMMMKMLEAGGMEMVVDNIRKADEDNPKGYYEFEKVKKIKEDISWLDSAQGKVVKMVSMLLYDLPSGRSYKIIFMKRKMEEILASQRMMLERKNSRDDVNDEKMGYMFSKHLKKIEKWLDEQKNIEVCYFAYSNVIEHPYENAQCVTEFMDNNLDINKMVEVIDKSLYRQRK